MNVPCQHHGFVGSPDLDGELPTYLGHARGEPPASPDRLSVALDQVGGASSPRSTRATLVRT